MAKIKFNKNVYLENEYFNVSKTGDIFKEVEFIYKGRTWNGALPKRLENQGLDLNDEEFSKKINECYDLLNPNKKIAWIIESDKGWDKKQQTYKVLEALYSGNWECRVCGPVPRVNPQAAARLRDLKKRGYIIGTKTRWCSYCLHTKTHDILVMLPKVESRFLHGNEMRKPMSEHLKARIKKELDHTEVFFNSKKSPNELVVDHKFPSQRWEVPESDNPDEMELHLIREKFQLLSNQTNMLKSRYCDSCVKTGIRGDFVGINWFYKGGEKWEGVTPSDESGCVGCAWYDLDLWKRELANKLGVILQE